MSKYILPSLIVLFFAACDCASTATGYVVDKNDHTPLVHATVESMASMDGKSRDPKVFYTDSTGKFKASMYVQGVAKCPVHKLTISQTGYKTERVVSKIKGDTIYLEKLP